VAPEYCTQAIERVFASGNREWISSTLNALATKTWTGLPLFVLRLILGLKERKGRDLFLGSLLDATNGLPLLAKVDLLVELSNSASTVLPAIKDESSQLSILILAKSTAKNDPANSLKVAKALRCESPATLGNLSAVYENITFVSADISIYRQTLDELIRISRYRHRHIRNSQRRALPRIEEILGPRTAVEAIKEAVKANRDWDEKALGDLLQAAIQIPSWTHGDSEELLRLNLPASLSAILLDVK